jgi:hypothetical protein
LPHAGLPRRGASIFSEKPASGPIALHAQCCSRSRSRGFRGSGDRAVILSRRSKLVRRARRGELGELGERLGQRRSRDKARSGWSLLRRRIACWPAATKLFLRATDRLTDRELRSSLHFRGNAQRRRMPKMVHEYMKLSCMWVKTRLCANSSHHWDDGRRLRP